MLNVILLGENLSANVMFSMIMFYGYCPVANKRIDNTHFIKNIKEI